MGLDWADLLCRLERFEVAQSVVLAYCECVPARAHGWFVLGLTYQLQRQHELALSAYERALQLDWCYRRRGQREKRRALLHIWG